jgi:hypothetical protein
MFSYIPASFLYDSMNCNKLEIFNLKFIVLNSQSDSPKYYRYKYDPTFGI